MFIGVEDWKVWLIFENHLFRTVYFNEPFQKMIQHTPLCPDTLSGSVLSISLFVNKLITNQMFEKSWFSVQYVSQLLIRNLLGTIQSDLWVNCSDCFVNRFWWFTKKGQLKRMIHLLFIHLVTLAKFQWKNKTIDETALFLRGKYVRATWIHCEIRKKEKTFTLMWSSQLHWFLLKLLKNHWTVVNVIAPFL